MFDDVIFVHGLLMSIVWLVVLPICIFITRFFKVTPKQNFPKKLDNKFWWYIHLGCNISAMVICTFAFYIMYDLMGFSTSTHAILGYTTLGLMYLQGLIGYLRGTTGGDYPHPEGKKWDHFDMTKRRLIFEHSHKTVGYVALFVAFAATFTGIYTMQMPWYFYIIQVSVTVIIALLYLIYWNKKRYTTYQAIFGLDKNLPGNREKKQKKN